MTVTSISEISNLISGVRNNLALSFFGVQKAMEDKPIDAFAKLKFDKVALDPVTGKYINFVEMLNQAYSDIVILKAAAELMKEYSTKVFELNMGASPGFDICSTDGTIAAECFAVVSVFNNKKIEKDTEKLLRLNEGIKKYIFFYSREDKDDRIENFTNNYPEIKYVRIKGFD